MEIQLQLLNYGYSHKVGAKIFLPQISPLKNMSPTVYGYNYSNFSDFIKFPYLFYGSLSGGEYGFSLFGISFRPVVLVKCTEMRFPS